MHATRSEHCLIVTPGALARLPFEDVAMNSFQSAAAFQFADPGLSRMWASFRLPSIGTELLLETYRKNAAAWTRANQVAFDGFTTVAQRHGELLKTTVEECGKATSDVFAARSFEARATRQAEAARYIYDLNVGRFRELCDIASRSSVDAGDILRARMAEAFDELRALFGAQIEAATEPTAAVPVPVPVLASPDRVGERSQAVEAADEPGEPEATSPAPAKAERTPPARGAKGRRPPSRS
ncbi:MAG TPA: TIGR01841 family phasin [Reyranella sp.]|nr:TIGR01841 family phasin [Reyranella sp.]